MTSLKKPDQRIVEACTSSMYAFCTSHSASQIRDKFLTRTCLAVRSFHLFGRIRRLNDPQPRLKNGSFRFGNSDRNRRKSEG